MILCQTKKQQSCQCEMQLEEMTFYRRLNGGYGRWKPCPFLNVFPLSQDLTALLGAEGCVKTAEGGHTSEPRGLSVRPKWRLPVFPFSLSRRYNGSGTWRSWVAGSAWLKGHFKHHVEADLCSSTAVCAFSYAGCVIQVLLTSNKQQQKNLVPLGCCLHHWPWGSSQHTVGCYQSVCSAFRLGLKDDGK